MLDGPKKQIQTTTLKLRNQQFKLIDTLYGDDRYWVDVQGKGATMWNYAPRIVGYIYIIKCVENGFVYVGQTRELARRKGQHVSGLKKHEHFNTLLQEDWDQLGASKFLFGILEFVYQSPHEDNPEYVLNADIPQKLLSREAYWMDRLNCKYPHGYNGSKGFMNNFNEESGS